MDPTFTLDKLEVHPLVAAEDRYQEAEMRLGLELLRYRTGEDQSGEQADRVELARIEWRAAYEEVLQQTRLADEAAGIDTLPF